MRHSTGQKTGAQFRRFVFIKDIGCVACIIDGRHGVYAEEHHLLSGGRRRGNDYSIGLCPWHHRGVPPDGMSAAQAEAALGPSLALSSRKFRARYGSDDALLEKQNELVDSEASTVVS